MIADAHKAQDEDQNPPKGHAVFDIAKARFDDLELIMELEESCFDHRERWSMKSWSDEFFAGDRQIRVIRTGDGGVLGVITVQLVGDTADLHRIAVASGSRRLGAAAALVNSGIATVQERGAQQMILEVAEDNHPAIGLYAKLGFSEINRRCNYYGGTDALVMRRLLTGADGSGRESRA